MDKKSSSTSLFSRWTVRKAAKFAVYELIMIIAKNHQKPVRILVEIALGMSSKPV